MPITVSHSIIEDGSGDYTTATAWESAEQRNIVSADEIEQGIISGSWDNAEGGQLSILGWTTDATRYIILEATGTARHNGTFETGSAHGWVFPGAPSLFGVIQLGDNQEADLIGLQASVQGNSAGSKAPFATGTGGNGVRLRMDSCISVQDGNTEDANYCGLFLEGTVQLRNCLCFHINPQTGHWARGWGWVAAAEGAEQNLAFNCNAINIKGDSLEATGFYVNSQTDDVLFINCISSGTEGTAFRDVSDMGIASGSDFNAADKAIDAGAQGANSRESQSFTFVDAPNNDFHLASGDTAAKGFGRDPSGMPTQTFTDDIDGDTREDPFDIGMDAFMADEDPPVIQGGSLLFPDGLSNAVPTEGLLYPRYAVVVG